MSIPTKSRDCWRNRVLFLPLDNGAPHLAIQLASSESPSLQLPPVRFVRVGSALAPASPPLRTPSRGRREDSWRWQVRKERLGGETLPPGRRRRRSWAPVVVRQRSAVVVVVVVVLAYLRSSRCLPLFAFLCFAVFRALLGCVWLENQLRHHGRIERNIHDLIFVVRVHHRSDAAVGLLGGAPACQRSRKERQTDVRRCSRGHTRYSM